MLSLLAQRVALRAPLLAFRTNAPLLAARTFVTTPRVAFAPPASGRPKSSAVKAKPTPAKAKSSRAKAAPKAKKVAAKKKAAPKKKAAKEAKPASAYPLPHRVVSCRPMPTLRRIYARSLPPPCER